MKKLMQNYEFDSLLREKLSNVEVKPSEHLWTRLAPVIPRYNPWGQIFTPFTKIFFGSLVFVGSVVITSIAVLNWNQDVSEMIPAAEKQLQAEEIIQNKRSENNNQVVVQAVKSKSEAEQTVILKDPTNLLPFTDTSRESDETDASEIIEQVYESDVAEVVTVINNQKEEMYPVRLNPVFVYAVPAPPAVLAGKPVSYASELAAAVPNDYVNTSELALNISLQPELYYFDTSLFATSRALDHSLNFSIQYLSRDFFFETGVSGTYVTHSNTYRNTTIVREIVDSYEQVDSVQFVDVWDPNTSTWITQPVFYTSVVNIYNDNTKTDVVIREDSYLYIQVPVFMGLRKDIRRFSVEAKTGFVFSTLLFTSEQDKTYSNEESNILYAEENIISLKRNRQYWSFMLGIGTSYKLSSTSEIFVTPTYRYLLNPLYPGNNPSRKTPYAFGLQTGIRIIF